ncbi:amidohydrolase family protein, partial [Rhizobium leguminosarum]
SDLVAYDNKWTLESLRPVIEHCLECFGPARAMFASDFPVAGLHASFDEVYQVFRTVAWQLSLDEQRALFFATANDTYRLGIADPAEIRSGCHV